MNFNIKKLDLQNVSKLINEIKDNFVDKKNLSISQKEKIYFFDSLYDLISSWIPITNSLTIMIYQTKNKKVIYIISKILKNISLWKKIEESFKEFPRVFSSFDVYMIKMWEVTWKLANSLDSVRIREEKNADIKQKVFWALIYPMIIITLSIAMIVWFMIFVIPKVQKMYSDSNVNLPTLTQNVINTSEFLQNNYLFIIFWIFLIVSWIIYFKKNKKTKIYFDRYILDIPIFWILIRKKILTVFSNTLWTLLSNWIMINEALSITKKSLENDYYEKRIDEILISIWEWVPLSELMWIKKIKENKKDEFFPIELSSIVKIWEQTWKLSSLLLKISNKFDKEIDIIVKGLSTAIEPVVIVFVWIIVWTMIMAILLPFFNMVKVI